MVTSRILFVTISVAFVVSFGFIAGSPQSSAQTGVAGTPDGTTGAVSPSTGSSAGQHAPSSPPAMVCGNAKVLRGPTQVPRGAVVVPKGNDQALRLDKPSTVYWFAPGVHTLGNSDNDQIIPSNGDTYIGAPGAALSGRGINKYAFTQHASHVTIEYLTIEHFGTAGGNNNEGVVNHNSAANWTIVHDTIRDNAGAGVMLGSGDVLKDDCLTHNGQYGFSSYTPSGPHDITVTHDEISYNDTYNWEKKDPGCGCSGGGKFWDSTRVDVTDDYIHDNYNVGIWADTDNVGVDISQNFISNNYGEGVMYEISYDGLISYNTFVHNAVGEGRTNPSFPTGAIYLSESGSDPAIPGPYDKTFSISHNVFRNNWSGVVLWENSNRFCGPDSPDNAGSLCTLDAPKLATVLTCRRPGIALNPLIKVCRWRTMNVNVAYNTFTFTRSNVGNGCKQSNGCGLNAIFSIYGSTSPYKAWTVPKDISDAQNNHFDHNTYRGPWSFMAVDQGVTVSQAQWTKGFTDNRDGSRIHFDRQDAHSTFSN